MDKIKTANYRLAFLSGILLGFISGILSLTLLVSHRMDDYYKTILSLENIIGDQKAKLEKLEETLTSSNLILQDIEIKLDSTMDEIDEIDRIDLEKSIKEKYTSLLGKEVHSIDVDILSQVVDKRIFKLDKKEYKLRVEKIILTEILKIYVQGQLID